MNRNTAQAVTIIFVFATILGLTLTAYFSPHFFDKMDYYAMAIILSIILNAGIIANKEQKPR